VPIPSISSSRVTRALRDCGKSASSIDTVSAEPVFADDTPVRINDNDDAQVTKEESRYGIVSKPNAAALSRTLLSSVSS
jgi:hypothetical protein